MDAFGERGGGTVGHVIWVLARKAGEFCLDIEILALYESVFDSSPDSIAY